MARITGTLHEDLRAFMISRWIVPTGRRKNCDTCLFSYRRSSTDNKCVDDICSQYGSYECSRTLQDDLQGRVDVS